MNIKTIELAGREWPMCLSYQAIIDIGERFGGMEEMGNALTSSDTVEKLKSIGDMLTIVIKAGIMFCKEMGIPCEDDFTLNPLNFIDIQDNTPVNTLFALIRKDRETTINVAPDPKQRKNAQATRAK